MIQVWEISLLAEHNMKLKLSNGWMLWTPNGIWVNYQITVGRIATPNFVHSEQPKWVEKYLLLQNMKYATHWWQNRPEIFDGLVWTLCKCTDDRRWVWWTVCRKLHQHCIESYRDLLPNLKCLHVLLFFTVAWLERGQFGFFSGSVHWSGAAGGYSGMLASDSRTPAWKGGPSLVLLPTLLMDSLFMKHGTQESLSRENTLQTSKLADGGFFLQTNHVSSYKLLFR